MLASGIKAAFLFPACPPALLLEFSPLPRRAVRGWNGGKVAWWRCAGCVSLPVCQGKGVAVWCDTLDYPGWLGIIFGLQWHPPKTETLCCVFSYNYLFCAVTSVLWHQLFIWHQIVLHFIYCKTCYHINSLKRAAHSTQNSLLFLWIDIPGELKEIGT